MPSFSLGPGQPDPEINFTACSRCAAVIQVTVNGQPVLDNSVSDHEAWHQRLRLAILDARPARHAGADGL